ncbi:MAG: hypothetical protein ACREBJ_02730 [Nitrosotalea sp.]
MKTALLISGLPRFVDQGFPSLRDAIIRPNSPDIFIHTWGNPGDQTLRGNLINMFNPNMLVIESPKIIHNTHMNLARMMVSHGRSYQRDKFVEMIYSMWYSIQQANLLKEQNRLEHNIQYDYVIRARFDITYTMAVDCQKYDSNIIYTASRPDLPVEMVDDRFAFASNSLMNIYCGGYNNIEYIFNMRDTKDGIFCGETILYELFKLYNIQHAVLPMHAHHLNHG